MISDNASTDGTAVYVQELRKDYPQIKYYRNEENIGGDANFIKCLIHAHGKYCLILSDDDVLLSGTLESISQAVKNAPDFVLLSHSNIFSSVDLSRYNYNNGVITFVDPMEYRWHGQKLIGLISCMVYPTAISKRIIYAKKKILQSLHEMRHMYIFENIMLFATNMHIIPRNCLRTTDSTSDFLLENILVDKHYIEMIIKDDMSPLEVKLYDINERSASVWGVEIFFYKQLNGNWPFNLTKVMRVMKEFYPEGYFMFDFIFRKNKLESMEQYYHLVSEYYESQLINFCKKTGIYLYGLGYFGEIIFDILYQNNISIIGGIVSQKDEKTPETFHDLPIYTITNMPSVSDDLGIIVAVKHEYQYRIIKTLLEKGYEDNMFVCYWLW